MLLALLQHTANCYTTQRRQQQQHFRQWYGYCCGI
jgi:hypothetical protein